MHPVDIVLIAVYLVNMPRLSEKQAVGHVVKKLADILGLPDAAVYVEHDVGDGRIDALVSAGQYRFVMEYKSAGTAGLVASAIEQLRAYLPHVGGVAIPLVVVPYMGEVGRGRCAEAETSWMDLSGNADISAPGLRVYIEGRPNKFKRRGRPSTAFAPKSSRVARWLLMNPDIAWTEDQSDDATDGPVRQKDLVSGTELGRGYVSRVFGKLEEDGLVERYPDGRIAVVDPALMLDAWWEDYDFDKHHVIRGHVAARSGDELLRKLVERLSNPYVPHAATGLAGAWLINQFAGFRITTLYLQDHPSEELLETIGFREEERGANTWLVVPNDEGVFWNQRNRRGVQCVHPAQVYLDLKGHPERSKEAAERLREDLLRSWSARDV